MTTTRASSLVGLFIIGALVLYFGELVLVRLGEPQFTPPVTLGVALFFMGLIIPSMAWPIRSLTKQRDPSKPKEPINPFYATRVLLLAKAGALTGALLSGSAAGIVVFILSRTVIALGPLILTVVATLGGVALVVGALIAERWCQIPPQSGDDAAVAEGDLA
jgi:hypothetical protein